VRVFQESCLRDGWKERNGGVAAVHFATLTSVVGTITHAEFQII
jgi:hypothetical protein